MLKVSGIQNQVNCLSRKSQNTPSQSSNIQKQTMASNNLANYQVSRAKFANIHFGNSSESEKIKRLSLLLIKSETQEKIQAGKADDPELKELIREMSKPEVANKVLDKIEHATTTAMENELAVKNPDEEALIGLQGTIEFIDAFRTVINSDLVKPKQVAFTGIDDDDVTDKLDAILDHPHLSAGRPLAEAAKGNYKKAAVCTGVRTFDNTVMLPVKKGAILTGAAKGATIGTTICPGPGTAIGTLIGGLGTWLCWNAARNKIEDIISDD